MSREESGKKTARGFFLERMPPGWALGRALAVSTVLAFSSAHALAEDAPLPGAPPAAPFAAEGASPQPPVEPPDDSALPQRLPQMPGFPAAPAAGAPIQAQFPRAYNQTRPEAGTAVLNFSEAGLKDILRTIAEITGENFIVAPGVSARISVQTSRPIPKKDVFGVFESLLEVNGLAAVKTGQYYKIVPAPSAKQRGVELHKDKSAPLAPGDGILNVIVPVDYISANDLAQILKPMVSPAGNITNYARANTLIITDIASNVRKALEIIDTLDVDAFKKMSISVIPLANVDVKTFHKELTEVLTVLGFGKDTAQLAVVPIERLNSLIVFCASHELLSSVMEWVERLDKSSSAEGSAIHTYYVQNDKASNIKTLLEQLFISRRPAASAPAAALASTQTPAVTAPAAAAAPTPGYANPSPAAGYEEVRIFLYEPSNALIIQASARDYNNILNTVKQLDRPPKQVLIDALIAEVKLDESTKYGIQWSALTGNVNIQQNTGIVSSTLVDPRGIISTPIGASAPAGLTAFATDASKFFAIIQALASAGKVDVLSNPHIVVKNYEKASINVGSDEPVATQSTQTAVTGTSGLIQNIEYRKTGVILTVTPQITEGGMVAMTIRQEVSDKSTDRTVGDRTYPSFTKREAETSVVARDRETLVIGGLIQERKDKSDSGIPLLSRIPLLGSLFKYTSRSNSKTELVILLTPKVISNPDEGRAVTEEIRDKLDSLKQLLRNKKN